MTHTKQHKTWNFRFWDKGINMNALTRIADFFRQGMLFIQHASIAFYRTWVNAFHNEEATKKLRRLAEKEKIDSEMLMLAATIYQKINMPEKTIHELINHYTPNLLQITEDLQTLQTLIGSGAILSFRINKISQENTAMHYSLADDDEIEQVDVVDHKDTLAVLRDKYRVPGNSYPETKYRRRAPRFPSPHKMAVAFQEDNAWVEAETHNISRTGLLLETCHPLSTHERIKLKLKNAKTCEDLFVEGRVVRKDAYDAEKDQSYARFGIAFDNKLPVHPRAFLQFEKAGVGA